MERVDTLLGNLGMLLEIKRGIEIGARGEAVLGAVMKIVDQRIDAGLGDSRNPLEIVGCVEERVGITSFTSTSEYVVIQRIDL